ncbi:MAG TPA: hypothetical protein PK576_09505, partial [Kiritimatiellia bacterium]|nr:hypothetical protein [Kiritimatiellia bacterium]
VSGFKVSGFQGFIQIGIGIGIGIDYLTTKHSLGFQGFRVSGFWFQGFIQIGIGIAIAIGIDCLTTASQSHSLTASQASQPLRLRAPPASQYVSPAMETPTLAPSVQSA